MSPPQLDLFRGLLPLAMLRFVQHQNVTVSPVEPNSFRSQKCSKQRPWNQNPAARIHFSLEPVLLCKGNDERPATTFRLKRKFYSLPLLCGIDPNDLAFQGANEPLRANRHRPSEICANLDAPLVIDTRLKIRKRQVDFWWHEHIVPVQCQRRRGRAQFI